MKFKHKAFIVIISFVLVTGYFVPPYISSVQEGCVANVLHMPRRDRSQDLYCALDLEFANKQWHGQYVDFGTDISDAATRYIPVGMEIKTALSILEESGFTTVEVATSDNNVMQYGQYGGHRWRKASDYSRVYSYGVKLHVGEDDKILHAYAIAINLYLAVGNLYLEEQESWKK